MFHFRRVYSRAVDLIPSAPSQAMTSRVWQTQADRCWFGTRVFFVTFADSAYIFPSARPSGRAGISAALRRSEPLYGILSRFASETGLQCIAEVNQTRAAHKTSSRGGFLCVCVCVCVWETGQKQQEAFTVIKVNGGRPLGVALLLRHVASPLTALWT